ncbi:MAG: YbjN domain-containing protein [Chitinophagaceae bacterium]|nr:YbjN domain-containing protein [Chitinophagaceae bacterium]
MFQKLFGWSKKKEESQAGPDIQFGRYSDNNKPVAKVNRWTDADTLYKEKKYIESIDAFFEYLRDDTAQNVVYERNGAEGRFHLYQGSKIVRGHFNNEVLKAEVTLARMPQPSVPVMRRLLEMNFNLYYSRFALDSDRLCMSFDSDIATASPSKLYYGLKELSAKADKQDDLLVQDFTMLETTDNEHIVVIPEAEKEVKYEYLQKWIKETLDTISPLDPDKFSGSNAYMLMALIYKIDYLITPEGKLLYDLEKITGIYFKKDERPVVEKNRDMIDEFKKMQAKPKEEVFACLFRSKYTFSIVAPQQYKTIADSIHGANQNLVWYRDNNYPFIATQIAEYGISYCQYSYSLPKAITELVHLYMRVNYSGYFAALGYKRYYDPVKNQFASEEISEKIKAIQERWKDKYPLMDFKTQNLRFDNLLNFDYSFTNEMEFLNTDPK